MDLNPFLDRNILQYAEIEASVEEIFDIREHFFHGRTVLAFQVTLRLTFQATGLLDLWKQRG
jgi:hypothetical protein